MAADVSLDDWLAADQREVVSTQLAVLGTWLGILVDRVEQMGPERITYALTAMTLAVDAMMVALVEDHQYPGEITEEFLIGDRSRTCHSAQKRVAVAT